MSVPPTGYFDVWAGGKVVNGPTSYLFTNKGALDVTFSLGETFADTSKINLVAFDYDFRNEKAPFEYTSYDAPGVTILAYNGLAFSLQGGDIGYTFGRFVDVDVLTTTDKADTLMLSGNRGPEVIATGAGNDNVTVNGYQALTMLGRGTDTFVSTDDKADLVLADSYKGEGAADQITVSAGSLVILSTIPGESNSNVVSATGNQSDITVITEDQFEESLIADPLDFLADYEETIDFGQILGAAQQLMTNLYPAIGYQDGVPGTYTNQGNFVPADAEILDLMRAFGLTNEGKYGEAITVLETEMDLSFGEAASLVSDMADTYHDRGFIVQQHQSFDWDIA